MVKIISQEEFEELTQQEQRTYIEICRLQREEIENEKRK